MARFEREARTLAALNHPNIATIHGFERVDGVLALVMELIEGETLADRLHRTAQSGQRLALPPAAPLAVSATGDLALALGTHARGIMPYGTLARVPLAGGAPREVQEDVKYADWSPDGRDLAIVRRAGDRDRLEYLAGTTIAEPRAAGGGFSVPRFSPRGEFVAAFELDVRQGLRGRVLIFDRSGAKRAGIVGRQNVISMKNSLDYFSVPGEIGT